jgi:GNAT superfamily N-acetyltransferase
MTRNESTPGSEVSDDKSLSLGVYSKHLSNISTTMASNIKIEIAGEDDLPELISIVSPAFQNVPAEVLMFGEPSPQNIANKAAQHLKAWRIHAQESSLPCAIKCVHTDPETGKKEIAGCAEWYTYDREREPERYLAQPHLLGASWMENEADKKKVMEFNQPIIDKHTQWMGGRPHALLRYMTILPSYRRRGLATMCVQWGVDRCRELGIPAYLEASEEGAPVYEKLGFERVDGLECSHDGEVFAYPVMVWWPEGMEKVPALK